MVATQIISCGKIQEIPGSQRTPLALSDVIIGVVEFNLTHASTVFASGPPHRLGGNVKDLLACIYGCHQPLALDRLEVSNVGIFFGARRIPIDLGSHNTPIVCLWLVTLLSHEFSVFVSNNVEESFEFFLTGT
jgi:hypothetical protein